MNFKQIKYYHEQFFLNQLPSEEVQKNYHFFEQIMNRGQFLKIGQIIFDDPLDMEAVSTPYDLNLDNLMDSPNGDLEWCYMVSRNGYLVDLGILYAYTNEEDYFELWKKYLFSFIQWQEKSPHTWRSLDVGLRLTNWMKSFIYISDLADRLTKEEIKQLEDAITRQVTYLENNFSQKNYLSNWGVLAVTGILATSQVFPELVEEKTVKWGWQTLNDALEIQFYDDGIQWEQSPMYHHEVSMCVWQLWLNSQYLNQTFPEKIQSILQKAIVASYYYCDQNYGLLPLHDSDAVDFTYIYNLYQLSGFLDLKMEMNPGIFYIGKEFPIKNTMTLPELFPTGESGFLAYKDDDFYFTLFNGRHGSGHGHASLGSLTLHYQGKELIKDPGRYTYVEHPLRYQLKEETSHSSLMIDETPLTKIASSWTYDTMAEPIFHRSIENDEQVIFEVSWQGRLEKGLVIFKRKIIYFRQLKTLLVINTTDCLGHHQLSTRYQIGDTIKLEKQNNHLKFQTTPFSIYSTTQASITINDKIWSPKYNEQSQHEEILLNQSFKDKLVSYECIYPSDEIELARIDCFQNNQTKPCEDSSYFGIKITHKKEYKNYEYYHSAYDTFIGDKLYWSKQGRLLYGKDKLYVEKIGEQE